MINIGGNTKATVQTRETHKNEYGESVQTWVTVQSIDKGYLDMMGGSANYTYNSKIIESTHVYICDYLDILVSAENGRLIINNGIYEITYIDNPMGLNYHLEIYLKYIGGVQNVGDI